MDWFEELAAITEEYQRDMVWRARQEIYKATGQTPEDQIAGSIRRQFDVVENQLSHSVMTDRTRGACITFNRTTKTCFKKHESPHDKIMICHNCPLWTGTDIIYEDLANRSIEHTYDWWRSEYVRTGQSYALDRMRDFVKLRPPQLPETAPRKSQLAICWDKCHNDPMFWLVAALVVMLCMGLVQP